MSHGPSSTPPGWYPDGQGGQRWWDGSQWTGHTQPGQPGQPGGSAGPGARTGRRRGLLVAVVVAAVVLVVGVGVALALLLGDDDGGDPTKAGETTRSPEEVAQAYLEATFEGDFVTICELAEESERQEELEDQDVEECSEYPDAIADEVEERNDEYLEQYDESYDDIFGDLERSATYEDATEVEGSDGDAVTVEWAETYEYTGDNDQFVEQAFDGETTFENDGTMLLCRDQDEWLVKDADFDPDYSEDCSGQSPSEEPTAVPDSPSSDPSSIG